MLFLSVAVVCVSIVTISLKSQGQKADKQQVVTDIMLKVLARGHYNPLQLNDEFAIRAYNLFLKGLDPEKRFLLVSDVTDLQRYQNKIDNELRQDSTEFFDLATRLLQKRIQDVQGIAQEILAKPFDLSTRESFELNPDKRSYVQNKIEQKEFWRKYLKSQVLQRYLQLSENSGKDAAKQTPTDLEKQARTEVANNTRSALNRLLQEKPENKFDRYLNAIASSFDPHTEYFPPVEKQNFDMQMSGTLEGIGAKLQEKGDYIEVVDIVPGSPSWRQKELKAGDLILKVAQGDAEPVDVTNMDVNDVVKLIRGKKGTEVRLTVKKPSGQIQIIPLIRDVVVIEETYAKSAILNENNHKYGYIYLPSFYHDFNNNNGRNAATDFRHELEKLNAEKITGLIVDLRDNGGGALDDAVKIGGDFIKSGPIVQVKDGMGHTQVLRDPDPELVYDGPLVVLVNSLSASASEILAAALQDYGRAVIVGSPTFGKGTVQTIVDLDQFNSTNTMGPLGSLKVTIQKFYRINGGSTQHKGVSPDVPLPELYDYLKVGERNLKYSMPWDTIKPAIYRRWIRKYDLGSLKLKSGQRMESNNAFTTLTQNLTLLKKDYAKTNQSLNLDEYKAEQDALQNETKVLKDYLPENAKNDAEWLQQIKKDAFVNEALNVLADIN